MILTVVSFIVVLGILVFVHEMGHYWAARHVGVRVEQFSIGFPPRMFGRKIGETEYVVSWIPLGGYVRLFGQNLDDEDPRDPRNYAAKPVWQRLYILLAGPAANLVLAVLVMPLVYFIGVETPGYRAQTPEIAAIEAGSSAEQAGFMPGDRILRVGGQQTATWSEVFKALESHAASPGDVSFAVSRAAGEAELALPVAAFGTTGGIGWSPKIDPVAGRIAPGTPAESAGIQPGDRILAVNGAAIERWEDISKAIQAAQGQEMTLRMDRAGQTLDLPITAQFNDETQSYLIGISPPMRKESHGPIDAFVLGTQRLWDITAMTFVFLGNLVTGQGSMDQVGGPVKIGAFIGEAARTSVSSLAFLMAVISLQLGVFNLLPIPALDGGHIAYFLLPEALRGSPLRPKLRAQIQTVGMTLLIALMVFVTYNDIVQLLS